MKLIFSQKLKMPKDQNSNSIVKHSTLNESQSESDSNTNLSSKNGLENLEAKFTLTFIFNNITIEPVMFMQMFGMALVSVIVQNLYIDRICRVRLGYSEDVCANLTKNHDSEEISDDMRVSVDGLASQFLLYRGIAEAATQVGISLFLGSWSDKHGNKIPLLMPLVGYFLQSSLNVLFTLLPDLPPEYLLISSLPVAFSGGMAAVVLSAFSYISSISTVNNRSYRIAIMEACWFFGNPVGSLLGAKIYKDLGFLGVFVTSAVLNLCAFIYGIIFVKDKKIKINKISTCCTDMFNISSVKETFQTVFKKRDSSRRMWVLLLIAGLCVRIGSLFGPMNCLYLFTRYMFQWNEQEFAILSTLEGISHVVGGLAMTAVCIKIMKFSDPFVGILSTVGLIVANIIIAFVPKGEQYSWIMYLSLALQMFAMMATIVSRSMLSKMVPAEELGKIFTLVACGETSMPIIASALYSAVFVSTEKNFPGAFSLISLAMNILITLNFSYFFILIRRNSQVLIYKPDEKKLQDDAERN